MNAGLFPDLLPVGGIQTAGRPTAAVLARMAEEYSDASRFSSAERYNGFDTVTRTLPELLNVAAEFYLVFVGEGNDQPSLEQVAAEFRISAHVHFLSGLSLEELIAVCVHADVFALPGGGGFGLVFLQSMACGSPGVISATAGLSDIGTDGVDGLVLQDPTDARALASMVRELCEELTLCARLGEKAAETAGLITRQCYSSEIAAIFEGILTNSRDGSADNGSGTLPHGSHMRTR